jgi:hypothetical protein
MDMNTGKILEDEFGSFEDEVLNAGWLPQPEVQLGLQEVRSGNTGASSEIDADAFMKQLYASQE